MRVARWVDQVAVVGGTSWPPTCGLVPRVSLNPIPRMIAACMAGAGFGSAPFVFVLPDVGGSWETQGMIHVTLLQLSGAVAIAGGERVEVGLPAVAFDALVREIDERRELTPMGAESSGARHIDLMHGTVAVTVREVLG